MLITNATANPTVQRFRLRSTSEPPPNGPAPDPDPERARQAGVLARVHQDQEHQDDADEDLNDVEDRAHCPGDGSAPGSAGLPVPLLLGVELVEDLDRLAAKRPVELLVVGVGQLAGAVVELGVADLAVLGLARGLEVGEVRGLHRVRGRRGRRRRPRHAGAARSRTRPPRPGSRRSPGIPRRARAQTGSRIGSGGGGAGCRAATGTRARRRANEGTGHSAIRPPLPDDQRAEPEPGDERRRRSAGTRSATDA